MRSRLGPDVWGIALRLTGLRSDAVATQASVSALPLKSHYSFPAQWHEDKWTTPKPPTRFYPQGTGSAKTDHARKSESIESLRAALNVFADPRFHGYRHYAHSGELADAESHSSQPERHSGHQKVSERRVAQAPRYAHCAGDTAR